MATSMFCRRAGSICKSPKRQRLNEYIRCLQLYPKPEKVDVAIEEVVEYPPIKPRWPPGSWGLLKEREAWAIHDEGQQVLAKERLPHRLEEMKKVVEANDKRATWLVFPYNFTINNLSYLQFVSKTHIERELPKMYDNINISDEKFQLVNRLVQDMLLQENELLRRDNITKYYPPFARDGIRRHYFIKQLIDIVMNVMNAEFPHLLQAQVDEKVRVEAFWRRRLATEASSTRGSDMKSYYDIQVCSKFYPSFLIRNQLPIAEFVSQSDALSSGEYPLSKYSPKTTGQFSRKAHVPDWIPGHKLGDPCEFSSVLINDYSKNSGAIAKRFQETELSDILIGQGMMTSFVSTVAQAYYQGFSLYHDITYPFTMQTVTSDGQYWNFGAYQLNTLQLWKDDEANALRNIFWASEKLKLYDEISHNKVINFNDEVLKQFIKFVVNSPVDRGVDLRPYLSEEHNPIMREQEEFFPYRPYYPRWTNVAEFREGSTKGYV